MLANSGRSSLRDRDERLRELAAKPLLDADKTRLLEFDQVCGKISLGESCK